MRLGALNDEGCVLRRADVVVLRSWVIYGLKVAMEERIRSGHEVSVGDGKVVLAP